MSPTHFTTSGQPWRTRFQRGSQAIFKLFSDRGRKIVSLQGEPFNGVPGPPGSRWGDVCFHPLPFYTAVKPRTGTGPGREDFCRTSRRRDPKLQQRKVPHPTPPTTSKHARDQKYKPTKVRPTKTIRQIYHRPPRPTRKQRTNQTTNTKQGELYRHKPRFCQLKRQQISTNHYRQR